MNYLLDTNVISELVAKQPQLSVVNWIDAQNPNSIYLSVITIGEIQKGIAKLPVSARKEEPMEPYQALGIRIVELPPCKMAMAAGDDLEEFDRWWSAIDKQRVDKFFPRDFMYHDGAQNQLVWLYALPPEAMDACPYPLIDFAGGLYAVAVSVDQDDADGERVYHAIQEWVKNTEYFELDESKDRPSLFHVITSPSAHAKMNRGQLDIYVPIR